MAITEDDQVFNLVETALQNSGQIETITSGDLTRSSIADITGYLGSRNLGVGAYLTHPQRYWSGIAKWGNNDLDQASINVIVNIRRPA